MALATSSGRPSRRIGMLAISRSVPGDRIVVSISPGEMAFTLIPCGCEVGSHLARERRERSLRGRANRAGKGVHARTGDRAHIDHAARGRLELGDQPARKHYRREEIHLKHRLPGAEPRLDGAESRATLALRRDCRIVDERVQPGALRLEPVLHLGNGAKRAIGIAEIDLDVIPGPASHGQFSGKAWREQEITRQPAEEKRLTVAWPIPRGAGQDQNPRLLVWDHRHDRRLTDRGGSWSKALRRGAPEHDAVMQPEGTVLPELDFERDQPIAAPISRPRHVARSPKALVRRSTSASSAARQASGRDWREAQAPMRLSRWRVAK